MKEYKCGDGHTYIVKDIGCLVCGHCTDVFWDYTNGLYMALCEVHDELITDGTCQDYIESEVTMAQIKMKQNLNSEYGKMVQKESTTRYYGLKLHKEKDADIIEYLEQYPNKQGAIKEIIRKWIYHTKYRL